MVKIGEEELKALDVLMDNEFTPYLVNFAEFREPFMSKAEREGSMADSADSEDIGGLRFLRFHQECPRVVSLCPWRKVSTWVTSRCTSVTRKVSTSLSVKSGVSASIHKAGVAHNDMHSGNIFIDIPEDGWDYDASPKIQILDLGLARVDYMAALMEAIERYHPGGRSDVP